MDNKVKQETEEAMTETLEVEKEKTPLVIKVSPNNKIDRSLLNPPTKPGMAPTFKKDGTPVELHYIEQNPDAPFKEMHWEDHRGKGNFKGDHPNFNQPDRMDMNKYKNIRKRTMDSKIKKEMDEVIAELQKFTSRVLDWREPVDPSLIERFETRFDVKLPEDYKYLLSVTNGFSLMGDVVLGLIDEEKKYDLFVSYQIEHFEVIVPQYKHLIPFYPDGGGNFYCFDTHVPTNGGDSNQVVFWHSNYEYNESDPPEITHQSLADFIKDWIILNTLERCDYNGDEK